MCTVLFHLHDIPKGKTCRDTEQVVVSQRFRAEEFWRIKAREMFFLGGVIRLFYDSITLVY